MSSLATGDDTHISLACLALANDALVKLAHLALSLVTVPVAWEGQVGEHEVDRRKSLVERFVSASKGLVERRADFFALKAARRGEDSELGERVERVARLPRGRRVQLMGKEVGRLGGDLGDIRLQVFRRKSEFDLGTNTNVSCKARSAQPGSPPCASAA